MCVALPGRVIEIYNDNTAMVDFSGNKVKAMTGINDINIGDNVLVHAGCIIQKVSGTEATNMENLFEEINEIFKA